MRHKVKYYQKRHPVDRARIVIQERDAEILRLVTLYRRLRTSHILRLIPDSPDKVGKRLRKLYDQGFLDRDPEPWRDELGAGGSSSIIYKLGAEGAGYLRERAGHFGISEYVLRRIPAARAPVKLLPHRLGISDTVTAIAAACRLSTCFRYLDQDELMMTRASVKQRRRKSPLTWHLKMYDHGRGDVRDLGITPDGFFGIEYGDASEQPKTRHFFLELDRGRMPAYRKSLEQTSIYRKLVSYAASREAKVYPQLFNINHIRILTVVPDRSRIDTILAMAKEHVWQTEGYTAPAYLFATADAFGDASSTLFHTPFFDGHGNPVTLNDLFFSS